MSVRIVRGQTPQQQADALADANLKRLESVVINAVQGKLHACKMWLDKSDLEAAYNLGWHGVCQYIAQGGEVTNLTGFLIDITYKRAFDIYRQRHEGQHADAELATRSTDGDVVDQVDDQLKIQKLIARMKRRLNENERKAVTLCLLHGFRRREAADMLRIEQASFQRIMDSATKKLGGIAAEIDARGCAEGEWSRLLRSYALGLLSETDRDYPRAEKHLEECEACDRYVKGLKGLAAVMPPVGLPFMPMLGHEKAILAHLYRMFGGGHGAGGAAAAQTGAGTAGATTGGGTLVSSITAGAAAKGAAVIAIAVVAVTIRSAHDGAKHHPARPRTVIARAAPAAAASTPVASNPLLAYPPRKTLPRATHKAVRKTSRKGSVGPARRSTYSTSHITATVPKAAPSAESVVEKEFEIEPSSRGASTASQDQSASTTSNHSSGSSAQSAAAAEQEFSPERR
jgi:DNA-directed RNA polymerase specialized sigma24 family protein